MSAILCKSCGLKDHVRNGRVRGHQRYRCKSCGYNFTVTKRRGVHPALRSLAIVLYGLCGVSMNKIGKMLGVSTVAVMKWIRQEGQGIETAVPHAESGVVMIDEMWHFVNGKKKNVGYGGPLTVSRVALSDGRWAVVGISAAESSLTE